MSNNKKQNKEVEEEIRELTILIATAREEGDEDEHERVVKEIMGIIKKARKEVLETEIPKIQKELLKDYERDIAGAREVEREEIKREFDKRGIEHAEFCRQKGKQFKKCCKCILDEVFELKKQ